MGACSLCSMDGRPLGTYSGTEKLFELGKADMAAGVEEQVEHMKIGAQVSLSRNIITCNSMHDESR